MKVGLSVAVAAAAGLATALLLRRKQSPPSPKPVSFYPKELGFPGLKGLDHLRSFAGMEKPVKEQASVKTDLDVAHTKLKKTMEQIHVLEAKLREAETENAKFKVRQTKDAKLWKGLDSKLSTTTTLCNQLTETLQDLMCQARAAEEEKKIFEEKLVENSKVFDKLSTKLNDLTMQLETADNTIRIGNREMLELRHENEELEKTFRDEHSANENAIKRKDTVIKQLEDVVEEKSAHLQTLHSQLQRMHKAQKINMVQHVEECRLAEDKIRGLERESEALVSKNNESEKLIAELGLEVKYLTESASQTDIQMQELLQNFSRSESENNDLQDKVQTVLQEKAEERETLQNEIDAGTQQRDSLENQIIELRNVLEEKEQLYLSSVEREKQLEAQGSEIQELLAASESKLVEAKKHYDMMLEGQKIRDTAIKQLEDAVEEKSAHLLTLHSQLQRMQKAQEINMVQHVEECRLAEDKIRGLEHESEALVSKKNELEKLIAELGLEVKYLTESASQTDIQMQELLQNFSRSESENNDLQDKVQTMLQEKAEERKTLQNEIDAGTQQRDSLENQIIELRNVLEEKEQLYLSSVEKEKQLEAQGSEIHKLLAASESKFVEAKKQYDMMLEGQKIELSMHLQELSQRSDQAINEIRKKYESEKVEIVNVEKEKADKLVKEMERKCDEKLSENKEEAQQYLMRVKGEHGAMTTSAQVSYVPDWKKKNPFLMEQIKALNMKARQIEAARNHAIGSMDNNDQHARMKEIAMRRAKELEEEEKERTRKKKMRCLAKLEELNTRILTRSSH